MVKGVSRNGADSLLFLARPLRPSRSVVGNLRLRAHQLDTDVHEITLRRIRSVPPLWNAGASRGTHHLDRIPSIQFWRVFRSWWQVYGRAPQLIGWHFAARVVDVHWYSHSLSPASMESPQCKTRKVCSPGLRRRVSCPRSGCPSILRARVEGHARCIGDSGG